MTAFAWLSSSLLFGCSSSDGGDQSSDGGSGDTVVDHGGSGGVGGGTGGGGTSAGGTNAAGDSVGGSSSNAGSGNGGAAGTETGGSGGTAGEAGSGGDGGAGGESGLTLVLPIERAGIHTFEFGNFTFEVDGMLGARIIGFRLDGTNMLTGPDVNPTYFGSTLWTGPESDWQTDPYMPVGPLDSGVYTMSIDANSSIVADGPSFTVLNGSKHLSVSKKFTADLVKNAVTVEYSLTNTGTAAIHIGHWQVTRVPPDGLTFYPTGDANASSVPYGSINVEQALGTSWFDHSAFPAGTASKNSADGHDGWVAHVEADAAGPLLLINQFTDVPNGMTAPGHREVEIFGSADRSYEEIELHSTYWTIQPGATATWQVRWYLRRLPTNTQLMIGNQALLDAVHQVIQ